MTEGGGASRPRLRLLPTVLLTVAILALPTVVYAWGRSSSSFEIQRVTVTGTRVESHRRVQRLLRREFRGHNLFAVTAADVRRALASLDYIDAASVDRDFPHTLRVSVVEHRPRAYALAGDRWYVLADDGYVICAVGGGPPPTTSAATATGDAGATEPAATSRPKATPKPAASKTAENAASPKATPEATATAARAGTGTSPAPSVSAAAVSAAGDGGEGGEAGTGTAAGSPLSAAARLDVLERGPDGAKLELPGLAVAGRLKPGTVVADENVTAALAVLGGLPARIRHHVTAVQISGRQLTLHLDDGLVVVWGTGERSLAKTVALEVVLERYRRAGRDPTFIDVAVPDTVLAKPILK